MPYCTAEDIIPPSGNGLLSQARLEAIIGLDNSQAGEDSGFNELLLSYITLASSEIDMAIGNLYQVPVPSTAPQTLGMLKAICVMLTVGYIYTMNADGKIPDGINKQIDAMRSKLQEYGVGGVYSGRIFIPVRFPDAPTNTTYAIHSEERIHPSPDRIARDIPNWR
jgi:hypothetical protein